MEEELEQAQYVYNLLINYLVTYSFQIVPAIIIMILGNYVAKKVSDFLERVMGGKALNVMLSHFTASFIKIIVMCIFFSRNRAET